MARHDAVVERACSRTQHGTAAMSQCQWPCVEATWRAFVLMLLARVSWPRGGPGQGHAASEHAPAHRVPT
jgi:hypothetical protein